MRSGNYKGGQRKVIFTQRIRSEHSYADEVHNMASSAVALPFFFLPLLTFTAAGHFVEQRRDFSTDD